jgi:hypothetical protein
MELMNSARADAFASQLNDAAFLGPFAVAVVKSVSDAQASRSAADG